uniref:Uncharacterized protein n=1 Tax=Opuntia streptacantha TaxID=393608 RepID=A0A7C9E454_OPUST
MNKASFILSTLAIFVFLVSTVVVPMFGEGQMVIEEVIMKEWKAINGEEKKRDQGYVVCASIRQECGGAKGERLPCCPGLDCSASPDSPPEATGVCVHQCAQTGRPCNESMSIECCPPLICHYPPEPKKSPQIGICAF